MIDQVKKKNKSDYIDFLLKFISGVISAIVILYASSYISNSINKRNIRRLFIFELKYNKAELKNCSDNIDTVIHNFSLKEFIDPDERLFPTEPNRIIKPTIRSTYYDKSFESGLIFDLIETDIMFHLSDLHKKRITRKIEIVNQLLNEKVDIERYKSDCHYKKEIIDKHSFIVKKLKTLKTLVINNIQFVDEFLSKIE